MTNRFAARQAKINQKKPVPTISGLPIDPTVDNGKELDLVNGTWKTRELEGVETEPVVEGQSRLKKKRVSIKYTTIKVKKTTHADLELIKKVTNQTMSEVVDEALALWMVHKMSLEQRQAIEVLKKV